MKDRPQRGEVWYYKPSYKGSDKGHIQSGARPVVIVSNNLCNDNSSVLLAVPCTTKPKKNLPTHTLFTIDDEFNIALCEQAGPVLLKDLNNKKYVLDEYIINQIDEALSVAFGLKPVYSKEERVKMNNGTCKS